MQLQADGNRPRTKLVWEKTRWATLPTDDQPKAVMLEWELETKGYTVVELDTAGATDSELEERMVVHLAAHPLSSTRNLHENVKGTNSRISEMLDRNPRFDCVKGPRGAKLWLLAATASETCHDAADAARWNPDEYRD